MSDSTLPPQPPQQPEPPQQPVSQPRIEPPSFQQPPLPTSAPTLPIEPPRFLQPPYYQVPAAPPTVPPPPASKPRRTWLWVLIGGSAFFIFFLAIFTLVYISLRTGDRETAHSGLAFGDKIGVIDLEGVIISPEQTVKELRKFADDDSIKAIIIHVNTPGGGAAASEEIYREVRRIRDEKKKKIVSAIETVGASGGYYVASGTEKIYANSASVVGSIGVIAEWYNYGDLLQWAKLKEMVIKSGEFKDVPSGTRELSPTERAYMQGMIDNMLGQFVQAVADGRHRDSKEIRAIADGRVWTGEQAKAMGLIDEVGDFQKAVKETAASVGIKGEPTLIRPTREKKSVLDLMLGDASEILPDRAKLMQKNVGFYYLWQ